MKSVIIEVICFSMIFLIAGMIYYVSAIKGCYERAQSQGFSSRYGMYVGCVYRLTDGKEIPEKDYRRIG